MNFFIGLEQLMPATMGSGNDALRCLHVYPLHIILNHGSTEAG